MTGKVWLVGAGPAGVELLTIKAKRVIEQADIVVYDALIGQSIVDIIPDRAEKINVGKRAGHHNMPQEEINKLLLSLARQGKKVVRLKGGDPFLFGRGGEELELLAEHQIPFEVVPGVTSAVAVPAYFGIPVTHREFASSVHIVTGHRKKDEPLSIDFKALKEAGGTLVFLMGTMSLHNIIDGLLKVGMEEGMPIALLQQGGSGRQKKISGTLATIEREAEKQGIATPTIIVVGEVVRLGEKFAWFEKLPLFGKKFLVTRPKERQRELADKLRELGAEVMEMPTIAMEKIHPNPALQKEISCLSEYRFLVFTSPSGVAEFMQELFDMGKDVRHLSGISIAAIGSGTAKALWQYGLMADVVPEVYSGKALGMLLREMCKAGDKVLIARSAIGNPELVTELQNGKEIKVTDIAVYITLEDVASKQMLDEMKERLRQQGFADFEEYIGDMDGVFFTSASTVRGFVSLFPKIDFAKVQALCIGEMTAWEAEKHGMQVRISQEATVEGLVELVMK